MRTWLNFKIKCKVSAYCRHVARLTTRQPNILGKVRNDFAYHNRTQSAALDNRIIVQALIAIKETGAPEGWSNTHVYWRGVWNGKPIMLAVSLSADKESFLVSDLLAGSLSPIVDRYIIEKSFEFHLNHPEDSLHVTPSPWSNLLTTVMPEYDLHLPIRTAAEAIRDGSGVSGLSFLLGSFIARGPIVTFGMIRTREYRQSWLFAELITYWLLALLDLPLSRQITDDDIFHKWAAANPTFTINFLKLIMFATEGRPQAPLAIPRQYRLGWGLYENILFGASAAMQYMADYRWVESGTATLLQTVGRSVWNVVGASSTGSQPVITGVVTRPPVTIPIDCRDLFSRPIIMSDVSSTEGESAGMTATEWLTELPDIIRDAVLAADLNDPTVMKWLQNTLPHISYPAITQAIHEAIEAAAQQLDRPAGDRIFPARPPRRINLD